MVCDSIGRLTRGVFNAPPFPPAPREPKKRRGRGGIRGVCWKHPHRELKVSFMSERSEASKTNKVSFMSEANKTNKEVSWFLSEAKKTTN